MENRFRMRISRMFRGSFGSCRAAGNLTDVVEKAVLVPQPHNKDYYFRFMEEPLPPKARPFPSICRPKCPDTKSTSIFPRQKISARYPPFISANPIGHTGPPASPGSPLNPFYKDQFYFKERKQNSNSSSVENKKTKRTKKNKKKSNRRDMSLCSSSSQGSAYFECNYDWFSSEEEDDTLFFSRSTPSSDSSGIISHHHRRQRKKHSSRRRRPSSSSKSTSQMVQGSYAVVKSSSDPYNDFRTSMVEMIVEKQMFSAKDLEQLLQCFLSLNSHHHHRIIVEVFTEIYEALFSIWS